MNWLLAQAMPSDPEKAVGTLERIIEGGVPLICLAVAVIAVIAAVLQYRRNADLEAQYRTDLETRAKNALSDAEKRVGDAKTEAKERAAEVDKLMRERIAAERESDATLAKAVLALEANTRMMEKLDRQLDEVKQLAGRVSIVLDRRSA